MNKILTVLTVLTFLTISLISSNSFADRSIQEVDYYVSLRSTESNVRSGPGTNYPIKFTFKKRGIPLHVISEYDNWNEIEDYEGQTGWIIQSLLTKKRNLMVRTDQDLVNMHKKPNDKSRILYKLENNVIGNYIKCKKDWCAMKLKNKKGWIKSSEIWGN